MANLYKNTLIGLMRNAYMHVKALNNEIHALKVIDITQADEATKNKLQALTLTLTLINDLVHPAHRICKKILNESEQGIIDYCINLQKVAIESKLVDECICDSCKEDKIEAEKNQEAKN